MTASEQILWPPTRVHGWQGEAQSVGYGGIRIVVRAWWMREGTVSGVVGVAGWVIG